MYRYGVVCLPYVSVDWDSKRKEVIVQPYSTKVAILVAVVQEDLEEASPAEDYLLLLVLTACTQRRLVHISYTGIDYLIVISYF
jgi:hypothetical protein